ncbi:hypothetical protein [Bdellovibrio sp. BCCA]|uniref:hypothetical protein n=1 Tax=Bdellovibrio sp. BCCA TaxID=3136281 RepID=UPI0030F23DF7
MTPQKWTSVLLAALTIFTSQASFSQTNRTVKRNVATVLFASLGGAILGLSTLSFYGEPQEHTNNITLGALLGFVGGVGYVLYDSSQPAPPTYEYSQFDQELKSRRASASYAKAPPLIQLTYSF